MRYQPASFDAERGVINPPSRVVSFNGSVDHNDGLLASSVARAAGISYEAAVESVSAQVAAMKYQLQTDGEVSVTHVGTFKKQGSDPMVFEPFNTPVASPSTFGLAAVKATPLIKSISAGEADGPSAADSRSSLLPRFVRYASRVAATIALLITLGVLLSTPIVVDRAEPSLASVSSMPSVTGPKMVSASDLLPAPATAELYMTLVPGGEEIADTLSRKLYAESLRHEASRQVAVSQVETEVRINESDPYCLIVASLSSRAEADSYISHSKDKSLRCLENDGRYRVYAATGATVAQASSAMRDPAFAKRYPGAWVCHR
jgi:hypothetical protein